MIRTTRVSRLLMALCFFTILTPFGTWAQGQDDLIIQTRLEQKTLSWLIDKTRLILSNSSIDDKLTDEITIDNDPTFTMEELSKDPQFEKFREMLATVFKVDLKNSVVRLRIPKILYKVDTIHANPFKLDVKDPLLNLEVEAQLKGLYVKLTSGIQADFMIPNPKTKVLESYFTASVEPLSIEIPKTIEPLAFTVAFQAQRDQEFKYSLKGYNLDAIPDYVVRNQAQLPIRAGVELKSGLNANHIKVNPIVVRLNHLTRSIDLDSFKPVLQRKMPQIISNVLTLVAGSLKRSIGPNILQTVFSSTMKSSLSLPKEKFYTGYATKLFSQPESNQLSLGVQGDLCTTEAYNQAHEQCASLSPRVEPIRSISVTEKQKALEELRDGLARGDSDVTLSVSEEYINRLLKTTVDANLWNEMLEKDHLGMGPKGAFVIFDQRTKNPELYLDLYYFGDKGIEKIFVNQRNPVRFALRMSTSMLFTLKDEVPYLTIKIEKLLSDTNEILYGIPEYDLNPKLVRGMKKKIARMIIEMAAKLEGSTAMEIDIPVFRGLGLEKTSYEATPYGRLNLYFKL